MTKKKGKTKPHLPIKKKEDEHETRALAEVFRKMSENDRKSQEKDK